ncbi:tail protein X [Pseudomonas fluorescens]|uniref:tail protein X n=1 Tax=Pseudomonas fluorescens TaxID=294 RepID=UPI001BD986CF|nr:tail protein X [Pseudomonas fluorescens]MBT0622691.1 tail protein X [Pseudomonas fluorescens]
MAMTCRTSEGDVLDTLCYQFYGHLNGTLEAVLAHNQGLADEMQPLQAGLLIEFPDLPPVTDETVQLWS